MSVVESPSSEEITPDELVGFTTRAVRYARLLQLEEIARALDAATWVRSGYRSRHAWLGHLTGESRGQVSVTLSIAEKLEQLPAARLAFEVGEISEAALLLLARAWSSEVAEEYVRDESMLVSWASRLPFAHFKTLVDTWVARADPDRQDRVEGTRYDRRRMVMSETLDGMWHGEFSLDQEAGRVLKGAIEYLSRPAEHDDRTATQRRADALTTLAKHFPHPAEPDRDTADTASTESVPPVPRSRSRRLPQLISTFEWSTLPAGAGVGILESTYSGPVPISATAIQRLACDAGIHRFVAGAPDLKVHYGRQTRTISPQLFDLLTIRDHGCRWPGCTTPAAYCEGHHADHWFEHDGPTEPDNLCLVCWHHHHFLHEQHWRIQPLGAGHFQLLNPNGTIVDTLRPPTIGPTLPTPPDPPDDPAYDDD